MIPSMFKAFGKNPRGTILEEVKKSPHYNTAFENLEHTDVMLKDASYIKLILENFSKPKEVAPSKALPTVHTDLKNLSGDTPQIVWFGHSSYLIAYKGAHILVDPVFENASPASFIGKPFKGTALYQASDMPAVDILIITHDHYDHLEYKTLMKLKGKIKTIVCPLGVQSHLLYWGFDAAMIHALDWNDSTTIGMATVTALPARHFSGRSLTRNKTLWNSYRLQLDAYNIFIGGDSGYGPHFKTIGDTHGPFDIAFIENGQYGKSWPNIHMFPEQTAQAAIDIRAKILFPVHWAKFTLALHPWNEPIKRLLAASAEAPYTIVSPKIGEVYSHRTGFVQEEWWDK